jgi:hypothetical protein
MTALEGRGREKGTVIWGPGYSDAEATARALAHTKTLKDGQCGYFTWVPIIKEKWYVKYLISINYIKNANDDLKRDHVIQKKNSNHLLWRGEKHRQLLCTAAPT